MDGDGDDGEEKRNNNEKDLNFILFVHLKVSYKTQITNSRIMDLRIIMKNTFLCHNSLKQECCLMVSQQFILNCPRDAKTHKRITKKNAVE